MFSKILTEVQTGEISNFPLIFFFFSEFSNISIRRIHSFLIYKNVILKIKTRRLLVLKQRSKDFSVPCFLKSCPPARNRIIEMQVPSLRKLANSQRSEPRCVRKGILNAKTTREASNKTRPGPTWKCKLRQNLRVLFS